jgi:hypothetical protein
LDGDNEASEQSTTVCLLTRLDRLAHHTHQLGIEAGIHAEGDAAADPCEDEEAETPDPGHASGGLLGEVVSLTTADRAEEAPPRDVPLAALVGSEALIVDGGESLVVVVGVVGLGSGRLS